MFDRKLVLISTEAIQDFEYVEGVVGLGLPSKQHFNFDSSETSDGLGASESNKTNVC